MPTTTCPETAWSRTLKNLSGKVGQTFKGGRYLLDSVTETHLVVRRTASESVVRITRHMVERIHAAQQDGAEFGRQKAGNRGGISYTVAVEFFVREALAEVVVVVSCVKTKRTTRAKARDLYTSTWFLKARFYAEREGDRWSVLSAKHGLISSETVVAPYERSLSSRVRDGGMTASERRAWAAVAATQIEAEVPEVVVHAVRVRFVVLAGRRYRTAFELADVEYEVPMKGLGILQQLAFLTDYAKQDVAEIATALVEISS